MSGRSAGERAADDTGDVCESGAQCRRREDRIYQRKGGGGLTVGLVCLVEDVLLKVFLVLHVGVDVGVVVLKQTHTQMVREAETTDLCVAG